MRRREKRCQQLLTGYLDLVVVRSTASRTHGGAYLACGVDYSNLHVILLHRGSLIFAAVEQLDHLDFVRHGGDAPCVRANNEKQTRILAGGDFGFCDERGFYQAENRWSRECRESCLESRRESNREWINRCVDSFSALQTIRTWPRRITHYATTFTPPASRLTKRVSNKPTSSDENPRLTSASS